MSRLSRWLRRRYGYLSGRPEALWLTLIARYAPGRSFLDVGCMWNVHGGYAFHAASSGASPVVGVDLGAAMPQFLARNAELGEPVRFLRGDLNDPALPDRAGTFDVVFCAGVLYHLPDPVAALRQLRRLCRQTLILATASVTEQRIPQVAVFLPHLDPGIRRRLDFFAPHGRKIGLDSDFSPALGSANWFWLPTPSCVRAMVTTAGFTVRECHPFRRVTTVVATAEAAG